jgi:hypothetical protein
MEVTRLVLLRPADGKTLHELPGHRIRGVGKAC